jgi:hypothetical protein
MKKKISGLWGKFPKEIKVASYIGLSAGIWAAVKALGVEYEGDALAIAVINILTVLLENRVPRKSK